MTWKQVVNADTGDADHFGGDDIDKISQLLSGTTDVDNVDLNSSFTIRSGKSKLRNPANTFSYLETASAITADRIVTEPLLTGNDTRVYQAHAQTLTNKTVDAASNTLTRIAQSPRVKPWGMFTVAGGTTATTIGHLTGKLGAHIGTGAGTNTVIFDTSEGAIANFVSTATANLNIGLVSPTGGPIGRRLFGLKMSARVKIDSTTSARMYVGFSNAALGISDTPLASAVPGVLVGFLSTATNFEIYHNDDVSTFTTTTITGPIAKNNSWHTIQIEWAASGNVDVIFDGTTQTLSTNIPLTTNDLFFNCVGQTTTTTARTFSIHDVWIEVDK